MRVRDPSRVVWISQKTTLSVDETRSGGPPAPAFPQLIGPPSDDICYATQGRQGAVKHIAPQVDVMVVVGSANSSNSVRLIEVALETRAGAAYRVDRPTSSRNPGFEGCPHRGPHFRRVRARDRARRHRMAAGRGFPTVEVARTERIDDLRAAPRPYA